MTGPLGSLPAPRRPRRSPSRRPWHWRGRVATASGLFLLAALAGSCSGEPGSPERASVELAASESAGTTATPAPAVSPTEPPTTAPPVTKPPVTTTRARPPAPPTTKRPKPPATRPPASDCHPSYSGACLKTGIGDYDCAGGSGNGPNYVDGPIRVHGTDPFDLDRDGDGVGCQT